MISQRVKAAEVDSEPMPVYGTVDGEPVDPAVPVYGTPESTAPTQGGRPSIARRESVVDRFSKRLQNLVRTLRRAAGTADLDWSAYPGLVAGDSNDVLDGIRLDDVLARNDRVLTRVRRALETEFRVHWWANTDREVLEPLQNSWGGPSLLETARSSMWRTTSGLTSVEDRDMAARIVGVALTYEGFGDQYLERFDDEWVLTARSTQPPESVVTLHLGFSEFELTLDSSAALAAEKEAAFRRRTRQFTRGDE